jgi:hypothetical protein
VCEPYLTIDAAELEAASALEVAAVTPVLRSMASAACWWLGRIGDAWCWQAVDATGGLVARMVSSPWPTRSVPRSIVAHSSSYHQEWIGSGQSFAGFVEGHRLEGLCNGRLVIGEFAGQHIAPFDDYYVARTLLQSLFLNQLVGLDGTAALFEPDWLPDGMTRVTGQVHSPPARDAPPAADWLEGVEYGDGLTRALRIRRHPPPPTDGLTIDVNGLTARLTGVSGAEEVIVEAHHTWIGAQDVGGVTTDDLVRVLESMRGLQSAATRPGAGGHDLRELMSDEWLRQLLIEAGCTAIEAAPVSHPGVAVYSCATPSGNTAQVIFQPQEPSQHAPLAFSMTDTQRVRSTDLFTSDHQAYGICHRIFVNVITTRPLRGSPHEADQAVDLAASLVTQLDDIATNH